MLYQKNIGRWPTWVLQLPAGGGGWSQLDYGLHAKYFQLLAGRLVLHLSLRRTRTADQKQRGEPSRKRQNTPTLFA